ncbi:unnamed protein product, partial [Choristocarpus tenellus]
MIERDVESFLFSETEGPPGKRNKVDTKNVSDPKKIPYGREDDASESNLALKIVDGEGNVCPEIHPAALHPGKSLRRCDGFDIMRKGSRNKDKRLVMLPGTLGLANGGKLGTLKDITAACPTLYFEFPEGRLKCTGRTVHARGRFFTLYADKTGAKASRMDCRDVFDAVTFFTKVAWVGSLEDNPEENPLPLPISLQALPQENPLTGKEAFEIHFGAGNPSKVDGDQVKGKGKARLPALSMVDSKGGEGGTDGTGSGNMETDDGEQLNRRSGRTKGRSRIVYAEKDEDELDEDSETGSDNSSDHDEGQEKDKGEEGQGSNVDQGRKQQNKGATEVRRTQDKDSSVESEAEVGNILDENDHNDKGSGSAECSESGETSAQISPRGRSKRG